MSSHIKKETEPLSETSWFEETGAIDSVQNVSLVHYRQNISSLGIWEQVKERVNCNLRVSSHQEPASSKCTYNK
jgi:hypothetical protein